MATKATQSEFFMIPAQEIDLDRVVFQEPRKDARQNINIPVKYRNPENDELETFCVVFPKFGAPFGVSCFQDEQSDGPKKYSLDLAVDKKEKGKEAIHRKIEEIFNQLDEKIVNHIHKHPKWIKQKSKTAREVIQAFHNPTVRYYIDKETGEQSDRWPPKMKFKLPTTREGQFVTPVYGKKGVQLGEPTESISKGSRVQVLVEFNDIWTVGGKFGLRNKVLQAKVKAAPSKKTYAFADSDSESDDEEETVAAAAESKTVVVAAKKPAKEASAVAAVAATAEESESESESESEDEE